MNSKTLTIAAVAIAAAAGAVATITKQPPCAFKPNPAAMCAEVFPDGGFTLNVGTKTLAPGTFSGPGCVRRACDEPTAP